MFRIHIMLPGPVPVLFAAEPVEQTGNGLDLWLLFGSIALFLAIVVMITLLRRWR